MSGKLRIQMIGRTFGRWTVLERAENSKTGVARWLCRCDCGYTGEVFGTNLRRGQSVQCNECRIAEGPCATTHGLSGTPIYSTYHQAVRNGATAWKSFGAFRDWSFANGYEQGRRLNRKDRTKPHCPENSYWSTEQQGKPGRPITIGKRTKNMAEWARIAGISREALRLRHSGGERGYILLRPPTPGIGAGE